MKILILGKNGMLGHVVYEYFKELGVTTYGTVSHAPNPTDIMYDAFKDMESIEKTIDEINILNATRRAFEKAFQEASETKKPDVLLVDAVKGLNIDVRQEILVHGDMLSYLIAAASIVAKTARDEYMMKMDELYPEYGFKRNKGYGTAEHIQAIKRFGPCAIHRKTFITKFV